MKYKQEAVQGDVIVTCCKMPVGLKKVLPKNGRFILAEGESTGHAHAIDIRDAILWEDPKNKDLYLQALKDVTITHEEHAPSTIQPGTYKISIVREYDYFLEESRKVVD